MLEGKGGDYIRRLVPPFDPWGSYLNMCAARAGILYRFKDTDVRANEIAVDGSGRLDRVFGANGGRDLDRGGQGEGHGWGDEGGAEGVAGGCWRGGRGAALARFAGSGMGGGRTGGEEEEEEEALVDRRFLKRCVEVE